MAAVVLYHSPRDPQARRVRVLLEQLEVPYEEVVIDPARPPPDFRSISAYGEVPAITHAETSLYGANVICEYLDEVFHGGLMPQDPAGRAHVRMLTAYADHRWYPDYRALCEAVAAKRSRDEVRERQQAVLKRLRELERSFEGPGPFLIGPGLTLADLAFATTVVELPGLAMHIPDALMKTKRWSEALRELPALQRVPGAAPPIEQDDAQRASKPTKQ